MLFLLLTLMIAVQSPITAEIQNENTIQVAPHPGGQTEFLSTTAFEVLFGGAAGPGKTFALVFDALGFQYEKTPLGKYAIEMPEYRGVLFRRQTTQLADLIDECKKIYPDFGGLYLSGRKGDPGASFNFPKYYSKGGRVYKTYTEGARIFLCHLNEEKDKENHQGFEYQYEGFDELTQFLYSQYIYLFSRARSIIPGLPPRIRATANPVGIGLKWVKERFKPHIEQYKIKYFVSNPSDDKDYRGIEVNKSFPDALSRSYIPGKLDENITLKESDPGYRARIKAMGIKMSKALLDSDWDVMEGQFFDLWNRHVHIIHENNYWSYEQMKGFNIIGCIDYGHTMVLSLLLKDQHGNVILFDQLTSVGEVREIRISRTKKFLEVRHLGGYYLNEKGEKKFRVNITMLGDTDLWLKDAFDLSQQEAPAQSFSDEGIHLVKVSKKNTEDKTYRKACNIAVQNGLYYEADDKTGEILKQPKIKVYARCDKFIETFPTLPIDEDNPEDIADVDYDHWYDSFKMAYMIIRETRKIPEDNTPQWAKNLRKEKKPRSFMEM